MKYTFSIHPLNRKLLRELPNGWSITDYQAILTALDLEDVDQIPTHELRDMCLLGLTDLPPAKAAVVLLDYTLGDRLSGGQIQNLAQEMRSERMWEEYPDMACHQAIYNCNELLYSAFNGAFPQPSALHILLELTLQTPAKIPTAVEHDQISKVFAIRLLAAGMDEHSHLKRLFSEHLVQGDFPEAEHILWRCHTILAAPDTFHLEVIGSPYWLNNFNTKLDYQYAWSGFPAYNHI